MSKTRISPELRERISIAARHRRGYCLTQEIVIGLPMVIDHIIPEARGGSSEEANLWLACRRCNEYKGVQTHMSDPETGADTPLFNPRMQVWPEHFIWTQNGIYIKGITPVVRGNTQHHMHMLWLYCQL